MNQAANELIETNHAIGRIGKHCGYHNGQFYQGL